MSEELRPCPFCGKPADDRYNRLAKCSNKQCLMNYWFEDDADFYIRDDWNTRPIEDALQSRIAELEKDLSNKEIEYTDLWDDALALQARIAELEAKNEKINYFFRRLRMFCIFAHWDNPNTEAEFYKVDAEIREYLSEYKVCIDPEVQE